MDTNNQLDLQDLLSQLGEFGPYQLKQHCLHGLAWLLFGVHIMSFVFVFPVVEHRCYVKEVDGFHYENINITDYMQMYIPQTKGKFESCLKYDNYNGTKRQCENGYVYNYTIFPSSRVPDWDMVCDKNWMRAFLQSTFLMGTLTGSLVFGYLADKYGRKPIFCVSGIVQLFFGVIGVFLDNYHAFAFSMFWYGVFGGAGAVVSSVALTMELVGSSMRSTCGTLFTVWFGIGGIIVAAWAYFLPMPAKMLELVLAMHSLLLFGHYWFMVIYYQNEKSANAGMLTILSNRDESICWLFANGNKDKAIEIAKKAIEYNGKEFKNCPKKTVKADSQVDIETNECVRKNDNNDIGNSNTKLSPKDETPKTAVWDLFRYPKLRQRTLAMMYCWFASCLTYFGLSFNSVNLVGNPYLMFVMSILSEIPGHLISTFIIAKTGNKPMFYVSLLITGASCIVVPLLPLGNVQVFITMMAKVTATITFNIINFYTAELFPTSLRNTAIGICMMVARTGAAIIPQINLLGDLAEEIPTITFGVVGIIGGFLVLFILPETRDKRIPQTIEDVENSKD